MKTTVTWAEIAPKTFIFDSKGQWVRNWFSNMVSEVVTIDGIEWNSVENYYQAMKSIDGDTQMLFPFLTPSGAKSMGRKITIRPDWDEYRIEVMRKALICKFHNNADNKSRLLQTEDSILVEWNNWGDKFWGVDIRTFEGENMLGKLLMEIRSTLRLREV